MRRVMRFGPLSIYLSIYLSISLSLYIYNMYIHIICITYIMNIMIRTSDDLLQRPRPGHRRPHVVLLSLLLLLILLLLLLLLLVTLLLLLLLLLVVLLLLSSILLPLLLLLLSLLGRPPGRRTWIAGRRQDATPSVWRAGSIREFREPGVLLFPAQFLRTFCGELRRLTPFSSNMAKGYCGDMRRRRIHAKTAQKISKSWPVVFPRLDALYAGRLGHRERQLEIWNMLRMTHEELGKGRMGSALMGSLHFFLFDRRAFWVLPLTYFSLPKKARAYLLPQSAKNQYFCSDPISLDPIGPQRSAIGAAG